MGLFDVLRGEREPARADLDRLFALTTAELTLRANLGYEPLPKAAVCFKPVAAGAFAATIAELDEMLEISEQTSGTTIGHVDDELGFHWVVLEDSDLQDLVTTAHVVNQTMQERGFGEQLLCSVFGFRSGETTVWLVYAYKRGSFYPFVPAGGRDRDTATELRLKATLERELPFEPELERWYPLWDMPIT